MFTDIKQSTDIRAACLREFGDDEGNQRFDDEVLAPHDEILNRLIEEFHGTVMSTAGDSFFATFNSSRAAVQCAVKIQAALIERQIPVPVTEAGLPPYIQIRIGLHTGGARELLRANQPNLSDHNINIAARISDFADAEQVLMSAETWKGIGRLPGISKHDWPGYQLKGVDGDWTLVEALWDNRLPRTPRAKPVDEQSGQPGELPRERLAHGAAKVPILGNVDRHNPHFQGRKDDLRRLHEVLTGGHVGILAAVHGVGGLGKTALALEYAHAHGHEYGGGRWQIRCEGQTDLRVAVATLAPALRIEFNQAEAAEPDLQLDRVMAELHGLCRSTAASRCLLILDNVDQPALLTAVHAARVPQADWLHLIVTTRLNQNELGGAAPDRHFLAVDELPEDDAVELIESYQPDGRFAEETEREAAREIARLLGGFTLAVENAAVFLAQPEVGVTGAGFLARLQQEGLAGLEKAAAGTEASVRHGEKLVTATLAPTLERLTDREMLAIQYAALLPADQIALPWLRALVADEFPDIGVEAAPGYPDAWLSLVSRLLGFRLLKPSEVKDAQDHLLVARIHRVVQAVVQTRPGLASEMLHQRLVEYAVERCEFVKANEHLPIHRWEIEPLRELAERLLAERHVSASFIANAAALFLLHLARYAEAEPLMRRALALGEQNYGSEHPIVAIILNNLAQLLQTTNQLGEAEPLMQRVLEITEQSCGPEHPAVATALNNLAALLQATNRLEEAEPLIRRSLAIYEQSFGPEHPDVAINLNNLAQLLRETNRLEEAEPLMRRALAIDESSFGPEHPNAVRQLNNLARLLQTTNRPEEAEPLILRALTIDEQSFGLDHPAVAADLNNLAQLLKMTNRPEEAEPLMRRALAIDERNFGPEHPRVAVDLNDLASVLTATNRLEEAEPLMRRALAIDERGFGADNPSVAIRLNNLAQLLQATNRKGEAEPLMARVVSIFEKSYGENHPNVATALNNLARLLQDTNRRGQAEPLMRRHLKIFLKFNAQTGHEHQNQQAAIDNYVRLLSELGKDPTAILAELNQLGGPFGVSFGDGE